MKLSPVLLLALVAGSATTALGELRGGFLANAEDGVEPNAIDDSGVVHVAIDEKAATNTQLLRENTQPSAVDAVEINEKGEIDVNNVRLHMEGEEHEAFVMPEDVQRRLQNVIRLPGAAPNTDRQWLAGEVYTHSQVMYGRFEVALRISDISGTLTTMFWYKEGSEQGCNSYATDCNGSRQKQCWEELDTEIMGRDRGMKTSTNVILREASNREMYEQLIDTPDANMVNGWAIFSMDWEPTRFVWRLNGKPFRIESRCRAPSVFTQPMGMRLNFWTCQDALAGWCGAFNEVNRMPAVAAYDWVKYYSFNTATNSYKLEWTDNFDTWDSSRWGVADWSFGENRAQFSPTQVFIMNGVLFMVIDQKTSAGRVPQKAYEIANGPKACTGDVNAGGCGTTTAATKAPTVAPASDTTASTSCFRPDTELDSSPYLGNVDNIASAALCQQQCQQRAGCAYFVWGSWGGCYLKGPNGSTYAGTDNTKPEYVPQPGKGYISGPVRCPVAATTTTTKATTTTTTTRASTAPTTVSCFRPDMEVDASPYLGNVDNIASAALCQQQCQQRAGCAYFAWGNWGGCYLKGADGSTYAGSDNTKPEYVPQPGKGWISGPARCPAAGTATTTKAPVVQPASVTTTTTRAAATATALPGFITAGAAGTLRNLAYNDKLLLGGAVSEWKMGDATYTNLLKAQYNVLVAENACKPEPMSQSSANCDRIYQFAKDNGMGVRFHTLLWHTAMDPSVQNMTPDQKRNWIRTTFQQKIAKYAGMNTVAIDVVNEVMSDTQSYTGNSWTFRQSMWWPAVNDFFDLSFRTAKAALPAGSNIKLCYNDYSVESMTGWSAMKSNAQFNVVKDARARGVPVDCVGFQFHIPYTWNMFDGFEQNVARYNAIGVEVQITELDVSCGSYGANGWQQCTGWDNTKAAAQAEVYRRLLAICQKYPNCKSYLLWGLYDGQTWIANDYPLIYDRNYQIKPAYTELANQLRA